ncbi:energy transducer TonB [Candidatus Marinarcus aquaticus]|nr:energy transducer TonB [Candidatus Marinarcus aquaticus]
MSNKRRYTHSFLLTVLLYAVVVSALVWGFTLTPVVKSISKEKTLSLKHVSLIEQEKKVIKQKSEPKEVQKPKEKIEPKPAIKPKKKRPKPIEKKQKQPQEKVKQKSKKEERKEQEAIKKSQKSYQEQFVDEHLRQIVMLIQKNIKYPKRARALKIQGKVIIEFVLLTSGEVRSIKAISGHRMLIKSSVLAIENASTAFPKVKEQLTLRVPIEYTLN